MNAFDKCVLITDWMQMALVVGMMNMLDTNHSRPLEWMLFSYTEYKTNWIMKMGQFDYKSFRLSFVSFRTFLLSWFMGGYDVFIRLSKLSTDIRAELNNILDYF